MKKKILIVDDDEDVMSFLIACLAEDYDTVRAGTCDEALRALNKDAEIDLLLTDIVIPGNMDGFELARTARAMRSDLKIMFISGYIKNVTVGSAVPRSGFLSKPLRAQQLSAEIEKMLGK